MAARGIQRVCLEICRRIWTYEVKLRCASYQEPLTVNHRSTVSRNTRLGKNVNFNGMSVEGAGEVTIGDNFHAGKGCLIITQNHDYDTGDHIPYDQERVLLKTVTIGDNVWLGSRVIILPGASLAEGSIIQAGSVVAGAIPKYAIAGGHPAKVFRYRDAGHYERLKASGSYC